MIIYQREPVFTIGQAPFLAGAIHVRNQIRALKQREKARKRKALVERFPLLRVRGRCSESLTGLAGKRVESVKLRGRHAPLRS